MRASSFLRFCLLGAAAIVLAGLLVTPLAPSPVRSDNVTADPNSLTIAEVIEAQDLLLDNFAVAPDPVALTQAGWNAAIATAAARGVNTADIVPPDLALTNRLDLQDSLRNALTALDVSNKVSEHDIATAAISAMADSLADGHTTFIAADAWNFSWDGTDWVRFTPAILYRTIRANNGDLVIWDVIPGGNAERAGVRPGDILEAVNGVSTRSSTPRAVLATNELSVRTPGQSPRSVSITAEPESMSPFETRMIGDTAYIYLFSFTPFDAQEGEDRFAVNLERALDQLADAQPTRWVLDLRNNRGGSIPTLSFMASSFGYRRVVAEISSRSGRVSRTTGRGGDDVLGGRPLVILVNGSSASASEVLAATLQDAGIGHVIGTRTLGAGHPARSFPLQRGGGLRIATGHLKAGPNGRVVEGDGVTPDDVVRLDLEGIRNGRDNQLERALDYLHSPVIALD